LPSATARTASSSSGLLLLLLLRGRGEVEAQLRARRRRGERGDEDGEARVARVMAVTGRDGSGREEEGEAELGEELVLPVAARAVVRHVDGVDVVLHLEPQGAPLREEEPRPEPEVPADGGLRRGASAARLHDRGVLRREDLVVEDEVWPARIERSKWPTCSARTLSLPYTGVQAPSSRRSR